MGAQQPSRIEPPAKSEAADSGEATLIAARRQASRLRRSFRLHQGLFLLGNFLLLLWLRGAWRLLIWGILGWLALLILHGVLVRLAERRAAVLLRRKPPKI